MGKKSVEEMRSELFYMMDACDECNDDAPDGAWWSIMEDCVRGYNKMNRRDKASFDPYQSVIDWLDWHEAENKKALSSVAAGERARDATN